MSRRRRRRNRLRPPDRETPPQGFAMRPGGLSRRAQVILAIVTILLALAFALGTPGLVTLLGEGTAGGTF